MQFVYRTFLYLFIIQVSPDLRHLDDILGVTAFIDNNCLEMAITGAGPLAPGPDAPRYGDEVQRSMYNGWKSQHGVKDQTVDGATGHTLDLFGPLPIRQNDLHLLRESSILHRWKNSVGNQHNADKFTVVIFTVVLLLESDELRIHEDVLVDLNPDLACSSGIVCQMQS